MFEDFVQRGADPRGRTTTCKPHGDVSDGEDVQGDDEQTAFALVGDAGRRCADSRRHADFC